MNEIIRLENVCTSFPGRAGTVKAVSDVTMSIPEGHITGLVGETGCGKSVLGQTILRLTPPTAVMSGKIIFEGEDLLGMDDDRIRKVRGRKIAYINQNPTEALNPVLKIGTQLMEAMMVCNEGMDRNQAREKCEEILSTMSFEKPSEIMNSYPSELSGGMKQRVMVAMAMTGDPVFLIADEPTKGLDALIRGQVIESLRKFIDVTGASGIIITHDLKFAKTICDDLALMYAGEIVEYGPADKLLSDPSHPYLRALLESMPQNGMHTLKGSSCSLIDLPQGCRFHPRCDECTQRCEKDHPSMFSPEENHQVRCWKYD
ncbi:MAG: ABC transporter ATP-binding protein [Eubacteriales bacterium]|nr:ABC transporter ATP-binding protein [Eubacteriales bacterium]